MKKLVSAIVIPTICWTLLAVTSHVQAQAAQTPKTVNPILVTVNGEPVFAADVSFALSNLGPQTKQQDAEQMVAAALKRIIETRLLAQEAQRRGHQAQAERVAQSMQGVERSFGGREQLEATLSKGGSSYQQLTKSIEEMELVRELINTEIRPSIKASEGEIKEFYNGNPELFTEADQVKARHILFVTPAGAEKEQHVEAQAKAELARRRALAGEDFAKLATELSEGPSAPNGGDLGYFAAEQMVEPFAKAAFALAPGGISEVVRTRFGYHVIKVEDRRTGGKKQTIEEVRPRIDTAIRQHKTTEAVKMLLDQLLESAEIVPLGNTQLPPDLFGSEAGSEAGGQ